MWKYILVCFLLVSAALAQNSNGKPDAKTDAKPPPVLEPTKEQGLEVDNLLLRIQNLELQVQTLRQQLQVKLKEITPPGHVAQQDASGKLVFVKATKPEPKP